MIDIKELRRLAQAATPGEWKHIYKEGWHHAKVVRDCEHSNSGAICKIPNSSRVDDTDPLANLLFIVAANPSAIMSLLDHIEQQQAEIARLRKDAERLDWLDRQGFAYGFQDIHEGNRWEIYGGYMHLRDAIDCGIKCDTSTQEVG